MTGWVTHYKSDDGLLEVEDLNGVAWYRAPLPPRFHRCRAQTRGLDNFARIYRCACGAASYDGRHWINKNETRKGRARRGR